MEKQQQRVANNISSADGVVNIVYYTDPLCCWSWAFEPQWRRLRYEFGAKVRWCYCMGGLIPSWKAFHDAANAVSRPAQMGPVWMEAQHLTGMPIQNSIWMTNPPASSYLACIAVKCAELQSPTAGEQYLRLLREAVMLQGKNIALQSVLLEIAHDFATSNPALFDARRFEQDLQEGSGKEAFRADLKEVQSLQITRFPTLIFRKSGHAPLIVSGHRPYAVLLDIMQQIAPELKRQQVIDPAEYLAYWGTMTDREMAEVKNASQ
jgi:predicted DsbA family dithiol-disulfide isomerase